MALSRGIHHAVTVYGNDTCLDTIRARALLETLEVEYNYYNIERDPAMARTAFALTPGQEKIPVITLGGEGNTLVEPTNEELEKALYASGHLR